MKYNTMVKNQDGQYIWMECDRPWSNESIEDEVEEFEEEEIYEETNA